MPLLKDEAEKLSNNDLIAGVVEEIIERDDMFAVLPFTGTNGKAYVYNRESIAADNNITSGPGMPSFVDPNDTITEGAAQFKEIIARLRIMAGDVDVDNFLRETMSDTTEQLGVQLASKAKAVRRLYHEALAQGNSASNTKQFDGIATLMTDSNANPEQSIEAGANGAALNLSMLDQLLDTVPNGADVIIMRSGTVRAFRNLMRAAGGTTAAEYMMPAFGRPMLTHNGVPIIVNDFISKGETQGSNANTTSIYAARLNEVDGLHGLYGGKTAGIRIEEVGTVQNKDARRWRVKWYAGLALKSSQSLARLKGITNV